MLWPGVVSSQHPGGHTEASRDGAVRLKDEVAGERRHMKISFDDFSKTSWLHSIGGAYTKPTVEVLGSLEELERLMRDDPDLFFEPPYTQPFEDWCLARHEAVEAMSDDIREKARDLAEQAFQEAFELCPADELCGLVSDAVMTIAAHLLNDTANPDPFVNEMASLFMEGRIPWGYEGEFPDGTWIIL